MKTILLLICIAALSVNMDAAKITAKTFWESDNPAMSISTSVNGKYLALVVKDDDDNSVLKLLKFTGNKVSSETSITICKQISCINFSGDENVYYIKNGNNLNVYNIKDASSKKIAEATQFTLSPDAGKILFQQKDSLFIKFLNKNEKTRKVITRQTANPGAWLNNNEFIFSCDGSLYKSNLQGKQSLFMKGAPYTPWFIACLFSPDGKKAMALSDDTKGNVGAATRSLWLFDLCKKKSRQVFSATFFLWADNDNVVILKNGKILKFNIKTGAIRILYKGKVESLTVFKQKIFFSEKAVDDIGLYENSSLKTINLQECEK
jgi:hypothetical protein